MNSYLRAIGFSQINNQAEYDDLIEYVIKNAEKCDFYKKKDRTKLVEYTLICTETEGWIKTGLKVIGEEDSKGKFHYNHMAPFCAPGLLNIREQITVNKKVDTGAYIGMCEDFRVGISLIFIIQNLIDYFILYDGESVLKEAEVSFSALSTSGTIILQTKQHHDRKETFPNVNYEKVKRMEAARNGDPVAMTTIAMDDLDTDFILRERIKHEDVFSIIETSIIPYGSESEIYRITGNIIQWEKEKNRITEESIYRLLVEVNGIVMAVSINEKDLVGEPDKGRRFRGEILLQGEV